MRPRDTAPERDAPPSVEITVLGGFVVSVDGEATPARGWSRRSAAALVKILALAPDHRLHREQVMDRALRTAGPHRRRRSR